MLQALLILAAVAVAVLPRPGAAIERVYGRSWYPALQTVVTGASNQLPLAAFDVAIVSAIIVCGWWWAHAFRALWRHRRWAPSGRAAAATMTLAAALYLWFVAVWGLNYARPPLDERLNLPPGAPTAGEVAALLDEAVAATNARYADSRADGFVPYRAEADIARALHAVEARLGRRRPTVPGTPKPTLLAPYFRMAGVDGLTAPFALETLLNPDLTPAERPFVLAHEWAHLSGHAPEADANFVAWLVTQEADTWPRTQYSGWLFLVSETARQVPAETRRASLKALGPGPRQDLNAISARMASRVDLVERVGWRVYDSYLRSQGVDEGVRSYSRVVALIVRSRRRGDAASSVPQ